MILAQAVIQILQSQGLLWVKYLRMKKGISQSNIHRIFQKVNQVIYIMYPGCMPNIKILAQAVLHDIYVTRLLYKTKCQKRTRDIIQPNIYRILPKVNQVIYTLDTICMPNIMILVQAVLKILWVKYLSLKRGIMQSNMHRSFRKEKNKLFEFFKRGLSRKLELVFRVQAGSKL